MRFLCVYCDIIKIQNKWGKLMQFRQIKRIKQALDYAQCQQVLYSGKYGTLAVLGDGGYPYAVPLNYVYDGQYIYIHCAKQGHKSDAIKNCDKVSFCVVQADHILR
jgi:nitroimidazol reductase NimA-like FMN-containing flavoprotein (pyridoxamine 5'-phosphate oxidase superfamily)